MRSRREVAARLAAPSALEWRWLRLLKFLATADAVPRGAALRALDVAYNAAHPERYVGGRAGHRRFETEDSRSDARLCGMSARGQSLSMFVVQRSFSRVRRGYDPDEVDRHLELVSRWFTSTDAGQAFTHERTQLQGRERAVASMEADIARVIEGARLEADATLDGARRRADADKQAAERTLAEAHHDAAAIRSDAEAQRAEMLDHARTEAAAAEVIRAAREHASTIVAEANAEAERIHAEARSAGERLVAAARADAADAAERLREQAEEQLQIYEDRRRREADRLAQSARRGRESAP